jgi:hypothetical protein
MPGTAATFSVSRRRSQNSIEPRPNEEMFGKR